MVHELIMDIFKFSAMPMLMEMSSTEKKKKEGGE
jgi:hypothetical protein